MDNVQNCDSYINIPSSQACMSYFQILLRIKLQLCSSTMTYRWHHKEFSRCVGDGTTNSLQCVLVTICGIFLSYILDFDSSFLNIQGGRYLSCSPPSPRRQSL
jgi:hypothetical protein